MLTTHLRSVAFAALVAGLLIRPLPLISYPSLPLRTCDGRAYHSLGVAWAAGKGLYIDDPQTILACRSLLHFGPSNHFAPALAVIEGSFIRLLGDTTLALLLPILLLSWGAVLVAWWTTRDLFGNNAGLLVAAAVSLEWTGVLYGTWFGYSENLVVITFTLTLWAILKALRDDRFLVLAGLFAGIGYLSKASIGWFFLIAGFGGLAWRVSFRGWRVLRNRWYWAAIAVFAVPILVWSYRNISLFWDGTPLGLLHAWQTSGPTARLVAEAFERPEVLVAGLVGKLPILVLALVVPFLPLLGGLAIQLRRLREEQASGLWLGVALVFILGWFFAGAFWVTERTNLLWADAARYVMPAQVPLLWLLVQDRGPFSTRNWTLFYLILAALTLSMPFLVLPGGNVLGEGTDLRGQ